MTIDTQQGFTGESATTGLAEGKMETANSIEDRKYILKLLREELVGPSSQGQPLDCSVPLRFKKKRKPTTPLYSRIRVRRL